MTWEARIQAFVQIAKGDPDAANFLMIAAQIARLADDLADGDSEDRAHDAGRLFTITAVDLHANPFFIKHKDLLLTLLQQTWVEWWTSEKLRKLEDRTQRMYAFVYRHAMERLAVTVALLCGGAYHAAEVALLVRSPEWSSPETFEEWDRENVPERAESS